MARALHVFDGAGFGANLWGDEVIAPDPLRDSDAGEHDRARQDALFAKEAANPAPCYQNLDYE
jgi:hypothetical protein